MAVKLPPFQAVLDDHREDVFRFLVALVGRQDADDCFQETLMSAIRAYPRLRPDANVRAWLFTIARRKAVDEHRARGRRAIPVEEVPERAAAAHAA
jgi:RNA polymerase sigma factor (sigma-70 family)